MHSGVFNIAMSNYPSRHVKINHNQYMGVLIYCEEDKVAHTELSHVNKDTKKSKPLKNLLKRYLKGNCTAFPQEPLVLARLK